MQLQLTSHRDRFIWILGIATSLVILGFSMAQTATDKEFENALKERKPQTALKLMDDLLVQGIANKDWGRVAELHSRRVAIMVEIDQGIEKILVWFDDEIAAAPVEVKPMLWTIRGILLSKIQGGGNLFLDEQPSDESVVADPENRDVTTWSESRIYAEMVRSFGSALESPELLKGIRIENFKGLLEKGSWEGNQVPTAYDFVVREILNAQGLFGAEVDGFRITADSPAFGSLDQFLAWDVPARTWDGKVDGTTKIGRQDGVRLWQDLLKFHRADEDKTALLHADLDRLIWMRSSAVSPKHESAVAYRDALQKLIDQKDGHVMSARATLLLAELISDESPVLARTLASQAVKSHPDSPFGKMCADLMVEIDRKELEITSERTWVPGEMSLRFVSRNMDEVFVRVYELPWSPGKPFGEELLEQYASEDDEIEDIIGKWMRKAKLNRAYRVAIADKSDHLPVETNAACPADLPFGMKLIVVSGKKNFALKDNLMLVSYAFVTPFTFTHRDPVDGNGGVEGFVVNAKTGAPISGVRLGAQNNEEVIGKFFNKTAETDRQGYYRLPEFKNCDRVLWAKGENGAIVANEAYLGQKNSKDADIPSVILFTDRAVYRPGQKVLFKGIVVAEKGKGNEGSLAKEGRAFHVRFLDANANEISKQEVTTNEFGSFSGEFDVPGSGLLGRYSLSMTDATGNATLRVEEYKRPVFEAVIESIGKPAAIGDEVVVELTATAFSGEPMDGATVEWTAKRSGDVLKTVQLTTNESGKSVFEFVAEGTDEQASVIGYQVSAKVVGPSGESVDASWSIGLGKGDYNAQVIIGDELQTVDEPLQVKVKTQINGGKAVARSGTLSVYPVVQRDPKDLVYEPLLEKRVSIFEPDDDRDSLSKLGERLMLENVQTDAENGEAVVLMEIPEGEWVVKFEGKDSKGREVSTRSQVIVFDPMSNRSPVVEAQLIYPRSLHCEPGDTFEVMWASGFEKAQACFEFYRDGKLLQRRWTDDERTQQLMTFPVTEELRGGFTMVVIQVNCGEVFEVIKSIDVPWTNRELKLDWKKITSKLKPGAKDRWSVSIEAIDGSALDPMEMVATLYDASLDALFSPHYFSSLDASYPNDRTSNWIDSGIVSEWMDGEEVVEFDSKAAHWRGGYELDWHLNEDVLPAVSRGYAKAMMIMPSSGGIVSGGGGGVSHRSNSITAGNRSGDYAVTGAALDSILNSPSEYRESPPAAPNDPVAKPPSIRRNLQETAFFLPHLLSDKDGVVSMEFTMPEAVTEWRFLGYAHDKRKRGGSIQGTTITTQNFVVRPNAPRFVRVGDEIGFTARLVNQGEFELTVTPNLSIKLSDSDEDVSASFIVEKPAVQVIPAKESRTVTWKLKIGETSQWLIYQASATAVPAEGDTFTDGEEAWLPVLPRRILVRDAMTRTLQGEGQTKLSFEPVKAIDASDSNAPKSLAYSVEAVTRPAWLAVKALPYLMEYPHDCSEQIFNRYYANSIAAMLIAKNPEIEAVFKMWQADADGKDKSDSFSSPLEGNSEQRGVLVEETPWLMEARNERAERLKIAGYFNKSRIDQELERDFTKLTDSQSGQGWWPWFSGANSQRNDRISYYIAAGLGRLRLMIGDSVESTPGVRAVSWFDREMQGRWKHIVKENSKDENHFDSNVVEYLYARSFYLADVPLEGENKTMVEFWLKQADDHWADVESLQLQANLAVALKRFDRAATAGKMMDSLRENALVDDDLGMHWRRLDRGGYGWWDSPIEAQSALIEAFQEVANDAKAVSACQLWLLQQKRTQHWNSTKATADALYALLAGGTTDLLDQTSELSIAIGDRELVSSRTGGPDVEQGTGSLSVRIDGESVTPADATVTVRKNGDGPSWVNVYWLSLQDISSIQASQSAGNSDVAMAVEKLIFVRRTSDQGELVTPLAECGGLQVGDTLVVRLTIRNDRAYEFVHIKDQRPAGAEPMDVTSGYKWNGGAWFYQETRDAATHFFIDSLPAGSRVLEYEMRLQHSGKFDSGVGEVECLYAPEFRARSASTKLEVAPLK